MRPGTRVILAALPDENPPQPEERGQIISGPVNGLYTVSVDDKYRDSQGDDGIREVPEDQISLESIRTNHE